MRPSRRRKVDDERREEYLRRLQDVFFAEGFRHLTMDDMAVKLECSKATLYAVASSKEQLVTAVFKRFFRIAADHMWERVGNASDPVERIAAHLVGVSTEMRQMSPTCCVDMMSFEPTRELYDHASQATARRARRHIQEGVEAGIFRPVRAGFVAEVVSLVIGSIQTNELPDRAGVSAGDAYAELCDLVLSALTNTDHRAR